MKCVDCGHSMKEHGKVGCMHYNKEDVYLDNGYCRCKRKGNYGKGDVKGGFL